MQFYKEKSFKKGYKKLPQHIQKKFQRQLKTLAEHGITHSGLGIRKMAGYEIWEARNDLQYRFTFTINGDEVFLRKIGTHEIYRNL